MKDRRGPKTSKDYTIDKAHEEHAEGVHPLVIAARLGFLQPEPAGIAGTSNQRKVLDRGPKGRPVAQRTPAVYSGKYAFDGGFDE